MRLHRLEVQALQAFAGRAIVDFDALAEAGLFLLHGDTGAGKTTLLDAVVLALYGRGPGGRVGRERSDHADPELETVVVLEATLRGERIRVTRWPRQERPKRRGEGTREEPARVLLERREPSGWRVLASRIEEAAAELDRLLGMSRTQFCQVVLLPQGEFATFLHAGSDEREAVLERLFDTRRFGDAEEWLAGRRRTADAELGAARAALRDVGARLTQQTGTELPAGWEERPDELVAWTQERLVGAEAGAITGEEACAAAAGARERAEAAVRTAEALEGRRARADAARADLTRLEEARPARDRAAAELAAARAAAPVLPLVEAAEAALTAHAAAVADADEALAAVLASPVPEDASADPARSATSPAPQPPAAANGSPGSGEAEAPLTLWDVSADGEQGSLWDPVPEPTRPRGGADDAAETAVSRGIRPAARDGGAVSGASDGGAGVGSPPPASPTPERLRLAVARLRARAGEVGGLAETEADLDRRVTAVASLEAEARAAAAEVAAATAALQGGPETRERLVGAYEGAVAGAGTLEDRGRAATAAQARLTAGRERDRLRPVLSELRAALTGTQAAAALARTAWLDVREARLDGMAAELAASLEVGSACPVCGGAEHPAPARPGPAGRLGPEAEEAARARHDAADGDHERVRAAHATAERELAGAEATAGPAELAALREAAAVAERAQAAARRAAGELQDRTEALRRFDDDRARLVRVREAAGERAASAASRAAERRDGLDADLARLLAALDGAATVAERVAALEAHAVRREAAAAALVALRDAESAAIDALRRALEGARAAGLLVEPGPAAAADPTTTASPGAAHAAVAGPAASAGLAATAGAAATRATLGLQEHAAADPTASAGVAGWSTAPAAAGDGEDRRRDAVSGHPYAPLRGATPTDAERASLAAVRDAARAPAHCAELEGRLRRFDELLTTARAQCADPELAAAGEAVPPALGPLRAAARAAAEESARVEGTVEVARRDARALKGLEAAVGAALDALAPVEEHARLVRELAMLVDGSAAANTKRMRLSAYVLAARLEEIAAAASVRLAAMSGCRYTLEHSDERAGGGRSRSGLDLRVVDGWTGRTRHPSTLSGGETFMASLALALGLADVVAAEAGGARLETLFVDEGFGSLDEATLDEVLDVLDQLRAGGRAVGIVSHVGELRQRIAAQLHVVKGRAGSTVAQPAAASASSSPPS